MAKPAEIKIADLIAPEIDALGYDLVRVHISGNGKYATLQIMAERKDGKGMVVEDCVAISKRLSEKFDASEDLSGKYDLEVSSPGIDRPLVRLRDYEAYVGHVAKVELAEAEAGKKRFQGKIVAVDGEKIEFSVDKDSLVVAFTAIEKAKLVLTDELLKAAARGQVSH